jgi:lysine biosynthesis protein LysW
MANGYCTECGGNINLGNKPREGQIACCNKCGATMVVVNLSPIELEWMIDDATEEMDEETKFKYDIDFDFRHSWS